MDKHKADLVYCGGYYIFDGSTFSASGDVKVNYDVADVDNILEFNCIPFGSVMVRSAVIRAVGEFSVNEWYMWRKIYKKGFKMMKMHDRLFYYRMHKEQASAADYGFNIEVVKNG